MGGGARAERDVRAAVHVRRVRELDLRGARGGEPVRAAATAAGLPRPYRVPGYPFTPALFIAAAGAVVVNTVIARPVQALIGLGIVATGLPAYYGWRAYFAWKKGRAA